MMAKDHTKWNYDALLDVIEGPLLNPKRMEEVIKVSRFMKRVMSFFHPLNRRFAELPRKVCPQRVHHPIKTHPAFRVTRGG
jgi:rapamycin-insensitive companion of mTOR